MMWREKRRSCGFEWDLKHKNRHEAVFCRSSLGWPTGIEPVPGDPQSPVLTTTPWSPQYRPYRTKVYYSFVHLSICVDVVYVRHMATLSTIPKSAGNMCWCPRATPVHSIVEKNKPKVGSMVDLIGSL